MSLFRKLCNMHGTDKVSRHRYDGAYYLFLQRYRGYGRTIRLLEIGILDGASLRVWQDLFAEWGCDLHIDAIEIDPLAAEAAPDGVRMFVGDQSDETFLQDVISKTGGFWDIVIDDGSHRCRDQQISFEALWPHVTQGGLYVIEDLEYAWTVRERQRCEVEGRKTTVVYLQEVIQKNIFNAKRLLQPPIISFAGNAAFITKPTDYPDELCLCAWPVG